MPFPGTRTFERHPRPRLGCRNHRPFAPSRARNPITSKGQGGSPVRAAPPLLAFGLTPLHQRSNALGSRDPLP
jgi:hypothetical protein